MAGRLTDTAKACRSGVGYPWPGCRAVLAVATGFLVLFGCGTATAQDPASLGDYFSKLGLMSNGGTTGSMGPAIGDKVAESVFTDDPAADGAIRDWYAQQDLRAPAGAGSPQPVPSQTAASPPKSLDLMADALRSEKIDATSSAELPLPAFYLAAVEAFKKYWRDHGQDIDAQPEIYARLLEAPPGFAALARGGTGPVDNSTAVGPCTVDVVQSITEPVIGELARRLDKFVVGPTAEYWAMARESAASASNLALMARVTLPEAQVLDQIMGGTYWVSQWHRDVGHTMAGLASVAELSLAGEQQLASDAVREANLQDRDAILAAYQPVAAARREVLTLVAKWIAALRDRGCQGIADLAAGRAAFSFAAGSERAQLATLGERYWQAFDLPLPSDEAAVPQWLSYVRSSVADADVLFADLPVEAILGPLPAPLDESSPASVSDAPPSSTDGGAKDPVSTMDDGIPDKGDAEATESDDPDAGWDRSLASAASSEAASQSGGKGTWISVAGVGEWSQPGPNGFWRTSDVDGELATLIRMNADQSRFDGLGADASGIGGSWLDMRREAGSNIWQGQVFVALRDPDGACPHWTEGALKIEPAATVINGAWRGKKVDPSDCHETEEPDSGTLRFERAVFASFEPIIPGKFIHLIAAPAAGSSAAQYAAAVEFACDLSGMPIASQRVTPSAGRLVELSGACRYQLVVDRPGAYDIRIDYLAPDGTVLHSDQLHADIPPIPGLAG